MLNRWIGILTLAAMLVANAAIFTRDVLPHWLPAEPPPTDAVTLGQNERRTVQVGIYNEAGRSLGTSWTEASRSIFGIVTVTTTTMLEPLLLPSGIKTPRVRVETQLVYRDDKPLIDELTFEMHGLGMPISLEGAAMPTREFACKWRVGPHTGDILLDTPAPEALGDVIRPFDRLPGLYVGQSWRLKLLDPLAQMIPSIKDVGLELEPVVIRVTGKTTIEHRGREVEVFVVEGNGAKAYAADDGRVLRQEVNIPFLGRLILLDEPYDEEARENARMRAPRRER